MLSSLPMTMAGDALVPTISIAKSNASIYGRLSLAARSGKQFSPQSLNR
jgi:hypothetical protein